MFAKGVDWLSLGFNFLSIFVEDFHSFWSVEMTSFSVEEFTEYFVTVDHLEMRFVGWLEGVEGVFIKEMVKKITYM